jgi:hypothetical protein
MNSPAITAPTGEVPRQPAYTLADALRDVPLATWRTGSAPVVARNELLERASARLAGLSAEAEGHRGAGSSPSLAYIASYGLLFLLTTDDAPTPQIAAVDDDGVEINWLVDGDWMQVDVDASGWISVFAGWSNSQVEIEAEFDAWLPDSHVLHRARVFLEKLSENVRFRA